MHPQSTTRSIAERNWSLDNDHALQWTGYGPAPCYYCGDPANSIDHTIPTARLTGLDVAALLAVPRLYAGTVPCCRDCNARLNDSYQEILTERKQELKRRLRKRWARLIEDTPEWTSEQIDELDAGYFRDSIIAQLAFRAHILDRLRW